MNTITQQINLAINNGLYYLALICALSLPDVCAALQSPNGKTTGKQYKAWYNAWMAAKYPEVMDEDIYSLRCGVVHQGQLGHSNSHYSRILFTIPNTSRTILHRNIMGDALNLDLAIFFQDMVDAVNQWYQHYQSDPHVIANLSRLVQYYPNGLPPYIGGLLLIS